MHLVLMFGTRLLPGVVMETYGVFLFRIFRTPRLIQRFSTHLSLLPQNTLQVTHAHTHTPHTHTHTRHPHTQKKNPHIHTHTHHTHTNTHTHTHTHFSQL